MISPYVFPGLSFANKNIEQKACYIFKIPANKLWVKTRKRAYVLARWFVAYFSYTHKNMSQSELAHKHAFKPCTINYAIKQLNILFEVDRELKKKYDQFENELLK